jgi:acetyltransferase-like isoleucine patch superfamily enzyme
VFGADVGDEVMLCPGVMVLKDAAPRATTPDGRRKSRGDFTRRPVIIERGATIGVGAALAPGVTIGAYAMVAIGAVVVRNVPPYALVAGNPVRQCGWVCVCGRTLEADRRCGDCRRGYVLNESVLTPSGREPTR